MMMARRGTVITQRALAKLNLVLRIRGRRSDGYHEIDSLMHTIGLADDVSVVLRPGLAVQCTGADLPGGESNLAYRAARLLAEACRGRRPAGALIRIRKRIPVAGGLAGGSADAAAVLSLLNEAWACGLPWDELLLLARRLGADVPFCLLG
ncbi:MAG: 4-(cytidine 5'-diphospho)-2-C-methyl-D-erythritol kinase, partial [Bacillota bacterium]